MPVLAGINVGGMVGSVVSSIARLIVSIASRIIDTLRVTASLLVRNIVTATKELVRFSLARLRTLVDLATRVSTSIIASTRHDLARGIALMVFFRELLAG